MPTINISRKVLEKVVGKKLPTEELKERIPMIGVNLENVTDDDLEIEVFPNRPDLLSEQGFGRAMRSFLGIETGLKKYHVKKSGEKVFVSKDMKDVRPYTVCALVKNLKLDDEKIKELIQIQEKLHITFCRKRKKAAIGIYPLEKIKLPIYFEARKPEDIVFRPLEWHKEINANEILEQHPTGIEYKNLVKGMKKYAIFRDSNNHILSFTPIINSHLTGKITDATKEAFVEVSGFDFHTAHYVLTILMAALADMGADIYSMDVVYPDKTITTPDFTPRKMKLDVKFVNKWLGIDVKENDMKKLLEKMGFGYEEKHALIPAYRPDVIHMVDIAEDVGIAYGFENFVPQIPVKATTGKEDEFEKFRKKISNLLVGLNMLELSSYHLSNKEIQFVKMNYSADDFVELLDSKSEDHTLLKYWMLPALMQVFSENKHHEYPQNIFESGWTFRLGDTETGVDESNKLAVALCGNDADYTKILQVLNYLFRSISLEYSVKETNHPSFIEGRVAKVIVKGIEIGVIGEMHPQVLENFEVEMPVSGFEIMLENLFQKLYQN